MFALGVTMYGQMTAGSYCYIGPQGIVHGTTVSSMSISGWQISDTVVLLEYPNKWYCSTLRVPK